MTKPVIYYIQSQAIELLVEKYGPSLESPTKLHKLLLLGMIVDFLSAGDIEIQLNYLHRIENTFLEDCVRLVQFSSERALSRLSMAITTHLHDKVYAE